MLFWIRNISVLLAASFGAPVKAQKKSGGGVLRNPQRSLEPDALLTIDLIGLPSTVDVVAFSGGVTKGTFYNIGGTLTNHNVESSVDSLQITDYGYTLALPVDCSSGMCDAGSLTSILTVETKDLPETIDLQILSPGGNAVRTIYNQGDLASLELTVLKGIYSLKVTDNGSTITMDNLDCNGLSCSLAVAEYTNIMSIDTSDLPLSLDLQIYNDSNGSLVRTMYNEGNKAGISEVLLKGTYTVKATDNAATLEVLNIDCLDGGLSCSVAQSELAATLSLGLSGLPTSVDIQLFAAGTNQVIRTEYNKGSIPNYELVVLKGLYDVKVIDNAASITVAEVDCHSSCQVSNTELVATMTVALVEQSSSVDLQIRMNGSSVRTIYNEGGTVQSYTVLKVDGFTVKATDSGYNEESETLICSDGACCVSFSVSLPCTDIRVAIVDLTDFDEGDIVDVCIFSGDTSLECNEDVGGTVQQYIVDSSADRADVSLKKSIPLDCSESGSCIAVANKSLFGGAGCTPTNLPTSSPTFAPTSPPTLAPVEPGLCSVLDPATICRSGGSCTDLPGRYTCGNDPEFCFPRPTCPAETTRVHHIETFERFVSQSQNSAVNCIDETDCSLRGYQEIEKVENTVVYPNIANGPTWLGCDTTVYGGLAEAECGRVVTSGPNNFTPLAAPMRITFLVLMNSFSARYMNTGFAGAQLICYDENGDELPGQRDSNGSLIPSQRFATASGNGVGTPGGTLCFNNEASSDGSNNIKSCILATEINTGSDTSFFDNIEYTRCVTNDA